MKLSKSVDLGSCIMLPDGNDRLNVDVLWESDRRNVGDICWLGIECCKDWVCEVIVVEGVDSILDLELDSRDVGRLCLVPTICRGVDSAINLNKCQCK